MQTRVPKQTGPRWAFRYVTGRPLDGYLRTDSTFFRPGTRALTASGRSSRWAMLPGWQRACVRLVGPPATIAAMVGYASAPVPTSAAGVALAAEAARRTVRGVRRARTRREYVEPLAAVLAGPLGQSPTRPQKWIHVPPELSRDTQRWDWMDRVSLPPRVARVFRRKGNGPEGRIDIPITALGNREARNTVEIALREKVHPDLDVSWHTRGSRPYIAFRAAPRPPEHVPFAEVRHLIEAAKASAPLIGMSATGPVAIDLDTDAPHMAASCGSGAGKSVMLRGLIAQWLHLGVQVVILDGKRVSQSWCKDIPGVRYCRTGEQLSDALLEVSAEVDRRFNLIDAVPAEQEDTVDVGPRIVVVFEEQNIGMQFIAEHWRQTKPRGAPNRPPAASALDHILCAGRQAKVHVVSVAQMFTVQAAGGNPAARENYGVRILARSTRKAWDMLAPECGPQYPRTSKRRGRVQLVLAGEATEVQATFWTVAEAREWATSGTVTVPATWNTPSDLRDNAVTVTSDRLWTLAEAAREEWCPSTYDALRQAVTRGRRAGTWPAGRTVSGTVKYTRAEILEGLGVAPATAEEVST